MRLERSLRSFDAMTRSISAKSSICCLVLAEGELVTKWDDDDWYGPHHLEDLIDALRYSGADLVGKAAEFVRLEQLDLTIRRFRLGAESYSSTIAGGTLLLRRSSLESVGGWAPEPRTSIAI